MADGTSVTIVELNDRLSEILDRIQHKQERFIIVQDGVAVARMGPVSAPAGATLGEIIAKLANLPPVDDRFAGDLEEIHNAQELLDPPRWPD